MLKKIAIFAVSSGLLLAATVPAFGYTNNCSNEVTGPWSYNSCQIKNKNKIKVSVWNSAVVNQTVNSTVNTGNNTSSGNTFAGNITTGDGSNTVGEIALVNNTTVNATQNGTYGPNDGTNNITGPNSTNIVTIYNANRIGVYVDNYAYVKQTVNATTNTGGNDESWNTISGNIDTGNATANITAVVEANNTTVDISQ